VKKSNRVLAIGIDSPTNDLLEAWIDAGQLPHLKSLKASSQFGYVEHKKLHSNQNSWLPMLTGLSIESLVYWLSNYNPDNYTNFNNCLYNLHTYEPFYALEDLQVTMFDLPVALSDRVNGTQVVGWASELNETYGASLPADLLSQIEATYGTDPKQEGALTFVNQREGREGKSYRVPSAYNLKDLDVFKKKMIQSARTRGDICQDLIHNTNWDLFITSFSEIHVAGHTLWHLSQKHPLMNLAREQNSDPLLEVYQCVDEQIGKLLSTVDEDISVMIFSVDNLVCDGLENPRSVFLPEILYRWNFPEKAALALGEMGVPPEAPNLEFYEHWKHEVWKLRTAWGDQELESPEQQENSGDTFSWQPTNWYKPVWPKMKAFALPSVADGCIRLNVKGREENGLIDPSDYDAVCDEITAMLLQVIDAREGSPIVEKVIRVRASPLETDDTQSPADLIVLFSEAYPSDSIDSPDVGRIGPIPFFRPGGHQKQGSTIRNPFILRPPSYKNFSLKKNGRLEDIPATVLALLGKPVSSHLDGRSLIEWETPNSVPTASAD